MKPEELKKRRKDLKLTQGVLAEILGVNISTVQRWESGEIKPGDQMLDLAIRYLEQAESLGGLPGFLYQHVEVVTNMRKGIEAGSHLQTIKVPIASESERTTL